MTRNESVDLSANKIQKLNIDEISIVGNTSLDLVDSEFPIQESLGGKSNKRQSGRKRKSRGDTGNLYSKKQLREFNRKYIEEAKRKSVFPKNFIFAKLIEIVKYYMKEFFIDPKDLVQNSSGQINRKKGGKRALSQGVYEAGDGPFDLKFDGTLGIRGNNKNQKDKKRGNSSGVSKPNHFWWIVSKAFLNYHILSGAKEWLDAFVKGKEIKRPESFVPSEPSEAKEEEEKETSVDISKFMNLLSSNCHDFDSLIKDDEDLEGIQKADITSESKYSKKFLLDDKCWGPISEEENEDDEDSNDKEYERVKENLKALDVDKIDQLINVIEDRFQIEDKDHLIACRNSKRQVESINLPEVKYDFNCDKNDWYIHDETMKDTGFLEDDKELEGLKDLKTSMNKLKEDKQKEIQFQINSIIELNRLGFLTDEEFHSDLNKFLDKLNECNDDQVILKDGLVYKESKEDGPKEEEKDPKPETEKSDFLGDLLKDSKDNEELPLAGEEDQIDDILSHLRVQLLSWKSENILGIQKLQKEITCSKAVKEQQDYIEYQKNFSASTVKPYKAIHERLIEKCGRLERAQGFKKKKGGYSHHKKIINGKRKIRRSHAAELGSDEICGDPNTYLKDTPYLSDKSEEINFEEIFKWKVDMEKFKEKIKSQGKVIDLDMDMEMKEEVHIKQEVEEVINSQQKVEKQDLHKFIKQEVIDPQKSKEEVKDADLEVELKLENNVDEGEEDKEPQEQEVEEKKEQGTPQEQSELQVPERTEIQVESPALDFQEPMAIDLAQDPVESKPQDLDLGFENNDNAVNLDMEMKDEIILKDNKEPEDEPMISKPEVEEEKPQVEELKDDGFGMEYEQLDKPEDYKLEDHQVDLDGPNMDNQQDDNILLDYQLDEGQDIMMGGQDESLLELD